AVRLPPVAPGETCGQARTKCEFPISWRPGREIQTGSPNDFCADVLDRMNRGRFYHTPVLGKEKPHGPVGTRDIFQKLTDASALDRGNSIPPV
ncbi:MAG: hypothetical protein VW835_20985, partial [Rickettsiales bacterium]